VDVSTSLATDLAALTTALGVPGADLGALLTTLSLRLTQAVPSCVGLRITVIVDDLPITVGTMPADAAVATSMRLPLATVATMGPGSVVVFYAARAGAFVDLAADLDHALGARGLTTLDDDLVPAALPPGVSGLDDLSAVSRAIGYLIGGGRAPAEAVAELDRLAGLAGVSRSATARQVIAGGRA